MVDIPGTSTGMEDFSMDSLSDALGKQVTEGLHIDETLLELRQKSPDAFDAKLMQMRRDYLDFYNEKGEIQLTALKEKLNWSERMALLVSHFLGENVLSMFFRGNAEKAKTLPFSDLADAFTRAQTESPEGDKRVDGKFDKNLLWLGANNPISQLMLLFNFADIFKEKTEKGEEPFPLPPHSRIILNASQPTDGPKMTPTRVSILEGICKQKGLKLDLIQVGEVESGGAVAKPGENTIQVVFVPREGLPLNADGKIDAQKLEWFQKIFEDGANNQWILTAPLLAAIYVRQGKSVADALKDMKVSGDQPVGGVLLKDLLAGIEVPGKQKEAPPPPADLLKDVKKADKTLDKAKLQEYHQKIKNGEGAWISPAEKAATQVLVEGAPVERALASAGIATTDPSYAQLKADLETLKAPPSNP